MEHKFTPGPWEVWEGPAYVGGGADLCIGAGDKWLANMDHRLPRCPQIGDDGHFQGECDICTIDSGRITEEQRANSHLIAAAPALLNALERFLADDSIYLWAQAKGTTKAIYDERSQTIQIARAAIAKALERG